MISYIKGKILKKTEKIVVISTGNLGYSVHVSKKLAPELKVDKKIELFIHSHIREDAFDLYGFANYENLDFFKILIGINGIGPKVALEILNTDIKKFKSAILNENTVFISKTPGIGAKTAKRMILELKDKVTVDDLTREHQGVQKSENEEIIGALSQLGFQKQEIIKTLEQIPENIKNEEEIINYFLKNN